MLAFNGFRINTTSASASTDLQSHPHSLTFLSLTSNASLNSKYLWGKYRKPDYIWENEGGRQGWLYASTGLYP